MEIIRCIDHASKGNSHETRHILQNHCILKYSAIKDDPGCSKRKLPPQATVRLSKRTHLRFVLELGHHNVVFFGGPYRNNS